MEDYCQSSLSGLDFGNRNYIICTNTASTKIYENSAFPRKNSFESTHIRGNYECFADSSASSFSTRFKIERKNSRFDLVSFKDFNEVAK